MSYAPTPLIAPVSNHKQAIRVEQSNLPFEIHTIEWMQKNRHPDNAPHRHGYFEITWVTEGCGTYLVDLEKHTISNNHIYCAAPGQVHQLKADEQVKGYVISFNREFLFMAQNNTDKVANSHATLLMAATVISLDEETKTEVDETIHKMVREFNNYFLLRSKILVGYFKILLIYLTRRSDTAPQPVSRSSNTELVNRFLSSVEKQFITNKKVTDYASHLAVTPNYLNEIVKRISGFPASYHIQQRIVLEAKRHATYSGASMKEIAYHLGFEDIAHFSKYFKNVAGQSFSEFRKRTGSQLGIA